MKKIKIIEQQVAPKFQIGDKCFAKVRGYCYWPAKIEDIDGLQFKIFFYGTNDHAFLLQNSVLPFIELTIAKHGNYNKKRLKKQFTDGMREINQDVKIAKNDDLEKIKEAILKTQTKTKSCELKTRTLCSRRDELTKEIQSIDFVKHKTKVEVSKLKFEIEFLRQKLYRRKDFKLEKF